MKKIEGEDFSGHDWSGRNAAGTLYVRCKFNRTNLREADCSNCEFRLCEFIDTNCYKTNFMNSVFPGCVFAPTDCYGMTLTMTCKTFENTHVKQLWWYMLLMFVAAMRPAKGPVEGDLRAQLIAFIGAVRYVKLTEMLNRRNY